MFKVKSSKSSVIGFDSRRPITLFSSGFIRSFLYVDLFLNLDPIEALRVKAKDVRIRVLTDFYSNPTTVDDVAVPGDVVENIKNINADAIEKIKDFEENKVLAETNLDVTSVLDAINPELAYSYEEGSETNLLSLMPSLDVAVLNSIVPKNVKRKANSNKNNPSSSDSTKILAPEKDFTFSQLDPLFSRVDMPKSFSANMSQLSKFATLAPGYGITLSQIGNYPFPIDDDIAFYRDAITCPLSADAQEQGLHYLREEDFIYPFPVPNAIIFPTDPPEVGKAIAEGAVLTLSPPTPLTPHASVLSAAYAQLAAYNKSGAEKIYVSNRQMKRIPFMSKFMLDINKKIPSNIIIEVTVKNDRNLIISKIVKQVSVVSLLKDTQKPYKPPRVSTSFLGDTYPDGLSVNVLQNDLSANKVLIFLKSNHLEKFISLGSFELRAGEEETFQFSIEDTGQIGDTAIIRVVSTVNLATTSSAFIDLPIFRPTDQSVEDSVPPGGVFGGTTAILASSQYGLNPAGDAYDVNIFTSPTPDGLDSTDDTLSKYDTLLCRRLDALTDSIYGQPGTDGGSYLFDASGKIQSQSSNGQFYDLGINSNDWIYVIDGLASDEEFPAVAQVNVHLSEINIASTESPVYDIISVKWLNQDSYVEVKIRFSVSPASTEINIEYDSLVIDIGLKDSLPFSIDLGQYDPTIIPLTSIDEGIEAPDDSISTAEYLITAQIPIASMRELISENNKSQGSGKGLTTKTVMTTNSVFFNNFKNGGTNGMRIPLLGGTKEGTLRNATSPAQTQAGVAAGGKAAGGIGRRGGATPGSVAGDGGRR